MYAKSVTVTGTIYGYKNAYDDSWDESEILDNRTPAPNLVIVATSNDLEFTTSTNSTGEFSLELPGDRDYQFIATNTLNNFGIGFHQNFSSV